MGDFNNIRLVDCLAQSLWYYSLVYGWQFSIKCCYSLWISKQLNCFSHDIFSFNFFCLCKECFVLRTIIIILESPGNNCFGPGVPFSCSWNIQIPKEVFARAQTKYLSSIILRAHLLSSLRTLLVSKLFLLLFPSSASPQQQGHCCLVLFWWA